MPKALAPATEHIIDQWMLPFNTGEMAPLWDVVHPRCTNYPVLKGQQLLPGEGPEVFERVVSMLRTGFPNDLKFSKDGVEEVTLEDIEYILQCFKTPPFDEVCPDDIEETITAFLTEAGKKVLLKATLAGTNEGAFLGQITNRHTIDRQLHLLVIDENGLIAGHGGCRNDLERARRLGLS